MRGELEELRRRLATPEVWCAVAEVGGEVAGHCSFMPAAVHRHGDAQPGLAHLWQLFVRRAHWGSGVAGALLTAAVEAAAQRGFAHMRLFTPAGQARARRFYEREGWRAEGPPAFHGDFGMELVEYRRSVARPAAR